MNVLIGHLAPAGMSGNILGLLVVFSVVLVVVGFVPAFRKWPGARTAKVVMDSVLAVYIAYHAVAVVRYALNEVQSNPQQPTAQPQSEGTPSD